jgi:hypothetical protein
MSIVVCPAKALAPPIKMVSNSATIWNFFIDPSKSPPLARGDLISQSNLTAPVGCELPPNQSCSASRSSYIPRKFVVRGRAILQGTSYLRRLRSGPTSVRTMGRYRSRQLPRHSTAQSRRVALPLPPCVRFDPCWAQTFREGKTLPA